MATIIEKMLADAREQAKTKSTATSKTIKGISVEINSKGRVLWTFGSRGRISRSTAEKLMQSKDPSKTFREISSKQLQDKSRSAIKKPAKGTIRSVMRGGGGGGGFLGIKELITRPGELNRRILK